MTTTTHIKYVNSRLHNSNASPVLTDSASFVFNDDKNAEVFNSYFSSVNVDDDGTLPDFPRRAEASINLDAVQFSTYKTHKAIKKLKPKFPRDPEGFPAYLITAHSGPLSLLFSVCLL